MEQKSPKEMTDVELLRAEAADPESEYAASCRTEALDRVEKEWATPDSVFPQVPRPIADIIRKRVCGEFHMLRAFGRKYGLREVDVDTQVTDISTTDKDGVITYTVSFTYHGTTCIRPGFKLQQSGLIFPAKNS